MQLALDQHLPMLEFLLSQGEFITYYSWLGVLVLMSIWEGGSPRRGLDKPIRHRWAVNVGLILTGTFLIRLILPILSVETARSVLEQDWGLLSIADLPIWLSIVLGILILDFARYAFHWAAHRYSLLWRIHRVHHTDQEFDFTTSLRTHPLELGLTTILTLGLIVFFGLHPVAVLVAETLAITLNTFNHGNVFISNQLDRALRNVFVTPDMHRVHHSSLPREFNANLGGLFTWWDRLFGTYVAQPRQGHEAMKIGLPMYADEKQNTFLKMLLDPFISSEVEYKTDSPTQPEVTNLSVH